jgi:hypothetical protein
MRRFSVLVVIFFNSTLCLSNWSNALTDNKLEEINRAIQSTGAKWIAGETSVSQLPEKKKTKLGSDAANCKKNGRRPRKRDFASLNKLLPLHFYSYGHEERITLTFFILTATSQTDSPDY